MKKKIIISIIIFLLIFLLIFYLKNQKKNIKTTTIEPEIPSDIVYGSNIIEDVYYSSNDIKGNKYVIKATEGEIDYNNSNIIFLTNVSGFVILKNSNDIKITSKYGKYNTENFDTIFSENVIIDYLDNNILGKYLDFSIKRGSMIMSNEIVYTNSNNILKADVIEMNIDTKDTKIYMFEDNKKINIKSKK
ncbi:LPS export ABC transporter periplasmic protein LptC [Candidatus Pelagibacter bacterium nBUS_33]|uniref:LPS export ABC transporter periplasmic protein LptC n=1 Tax=Candidatus Pelagibacter bacterium nBUS_33 TaxID=3374193 RepID=UPI003EBF599C